MNKLALLPVAAALISGCSAQKAKTTQVATVSAAKSIQAGPLQITAVDTQYDTWGWRQLSLGQRSSITGWGVRVHVVNTTDKEVSEYIGPAGLQMTNGLGKKYSISDEFLFWLPHANLGQLSRQGLGGSLLLFNTGSAVKISGGEGTVGTFVSLYDEKNKEQIMNLQLSPKKAVALVFVFDSPQESKPQTLAWPKAKPIDLR
jgi:hypothetical protein